MISLLLASIAILLIGTAIAYVLSQAGKRELPAKMRKRLQKLSPQSSEKIDDQQGAEEKVLPLSATTHSPGESRRLRIEEWLRRGGQNPRRFWWRSLFFDALISVLLALFLTPWVGVVYFFLFHPILTYLRVAMAIQKRAAQALLDLPGFLDSVVRISRIGTSLPAALTAATKDAEGPIREVFSQVMRRERAGMPIDRALLVVGERYHLRELAILATVLRLNLRYGGRSDIILERIADWLRNRVSAQAELRALSAETRFSALVLSIMIPGLGVYVAIMNHGPLMTMWQTPVGRILLIAGGCLIATGVYLIQRLSKLR